MFEAYKIGVEIALKNGLSRVLVGISGEFKGLNRDISGTQSHLNALHGQLLKIQRLGAISGGVAALGFGGLALLKGPYEEAKKWAQARTDFENLNLSAMDNTRAFGMAATNSHKVLGTTLTDNLKTIQDLHTAMGDLNNALDLSGAYAQFTVAARVQNGGKDVEGLVNNSIKALEHRGDRVMQNQETRLRELYRQSQVDFATKGRVNPTQYFELSQTGKMAYTLANEDFLYGPMAAFMSAKSGTTAGTAQMTTLSSLIGGHMTKKAIGFLRGLDLWEDQESPLVAKMKKNLNADPEVQKLMAATGDKLIQSGGLPEWAATLAAQNTNDFTLKVLVPAMRKKYGLNLSDDAVAQMLMKEFNRGTSDDLGFWVLNQAKVKKDTAVIGAAKGYSSAYDAYMKSPEGAEEAAGHAWTNLKTVIGSIYLPKITEGLLWLAKSLDRLSTWTEAHPDLTKGLVAGFGALAAAMAIGGTIGLVTAGFKGLGLALEVASLGKLGTIGSGLAEISGVTGLAGLGSTLGTIAGGLGLLVGATMAMKWTLENVVDPDTDELNHPGRRRHHHRGHPDTWDVDSTLSQNHAGMHFLRAGRGGAWVPDPVMPPPPPEAQDTHKGYHFVGRGASGQWVKDGEQAPAESQKTRTRPDQASVNVHIHMDSREIARYMVPSNMMGTTDMNPSAAMLLPGSSNYGLG